MFNNRRYTFVHDLNIDKIDFNLLIQNSKKSTRRIGDYHIISFIIDNAAKLTYSNSYFRIIGGNKRILTHTEIMKMLENTELGKRMTREDKIEEILGYDISL